MGDSDRDRTGQPPVGRGGPSPFSGVPFDPAAAYYASMVPYAVGNQGEPPTWLDNALQAPEGYDPKLLKDTAHCLKEMGRYLEALSLVIEGIRLYPDYTDLYFLFGTISMSLGMVGEAEEAFQACLNRGEAPKQYCTLDGVGSYLAQYNLGVLYELTGMSERASTYYCLAARAGYSPAEVRARLLGKSCRF